jgi:hypothetical protein
MWSSDVIVVLALMLLIGCSTTVPPAKVCGTYIGSYAFGAEELTLNQDGSFVQQVTVHNQQPATARGSWSFNPVRSKIDLHGAMAVVDELGHLELNWRRTLDLPSQPVELLWFRVEIEINPEYPLIKQ